MVSVRLINDIKKYVFAVIATIFILSILVPALKPNIYESFALLFLTPVIILRLISKTKTYSKNENTDKGEPFKKTVLKSIAIAIIIIVLTLTYAFFTWHPV